MALDELDPISTVMVTISRLPLPSSTDRRGSTARRAAEEPRDASEQPAWARNEAEETAQRAREAVEEREREEKRALMSARVDLRQKIENDLDVLALGIDALEQRSIRAPMSMGLEIHRLLRELTIARAAVERDLQELRPITSGELRRMKRGLEMRVTELKQSLQRVEFRI